MYSIFVLPWKLTCPLNNIDCKTLFFLKWHLFRGRLLVFRDVYIYIFFFIIVYLCIYIVDGFKVRICLGTNHGLPMNYCRWLCTSKVMPDFSYQRSYSAYVCWNPQLFLYGCYFKAHRNQCGVATYGDLQLSLMFSRFRQCKFHMGSWIKLRMKAQTCRDFLRLQRGKEH